MSCRNINGQLYYCNGQCAIGKIWGTNPYTSDTNPCTAARHSGQMNEGYFVAEKQPSLQIYSGSLANGINSLGYGPYRASIFIRVATIQEIQAEKEQTDKQIIESDTIKQNLQKQLEESRNELITLKQSSQKQTEEHSLIIISLNQKINIQENQIQQKDQEIQSLNQKFQDENKDLLHLRNKSLESYFLLSPILQKFEEINNRYLQNERKALVFNLPSIKISDISTIQYEGSMQYLLKFSQNLLEELNNKQIAIGEKITGIKQIKETANQDIINQNFPQILIEQIIGAFDIQLEDLNQASNNFKEYEQNIKELINELDTKQKVIDDTDEQTVIKQEINSERM